jgi:hypothetical protein
MPTISIFIRKDDLPKWQSLEKKSEFMHKALQAVDIVSSPGKARLYAEIATRRENELIANTEISPPAPVSTVRLKNGICKIHGTPLDSMGRCLQKGCKYA